MLIVALVLAVIGLAALVFAVVTSNELVAWVCIAAGALGVVLLIIDALQERQRRKAGGTTKQPAEAKSRPAEDTTAESPTQETVYEDYPEDAPDKGETDTGAGEMSSGAPEPGTTEQPEVPADYRRGDTVSDDNTG